MKYRIKALLLGAMLAGALSGCGAENVQNANHNPEISQVTAAEPETTTAQPEPEPQEPNPLMPAAQPVSGKEPDETFLAAQTAFALRLTQEAVKADGSVNLLVSPYSVMQALSMTANGAAGNTRTETEQTLGGIPLDALNEYLYTFRTSMPDSPNCKFRTANSLWIREEGSRIRPKERFLQTNADYYAAEACMLPFDEAARERINQWCSRQTDNMIPEILSDPIPEEAVMYLINAVCFDAKWAEQYEGESVPHDFTAADGSTEQVQMMYSDESQYLSCENACGFMKNYQGNGYAFAAVLPEEGMTPAEWLVSATPETLRTMLTECEYEPVLTGLPEFSYDYDAELSRLLMKMGMQSAFDPYAADFSEMAETESGCLYINRVLHKTHIEVDREGTKAAAATAVEMADECVSEMPEKEVILDRPFVYMIVETETMIPVFIGILNTAV